MLWEFTPHHTMRNFLLSDWGIPIESAVRSVAAVAVACYVLGAMAKDWILQLSDELAAAVAAKPPVPVPRPAVLYACRPVVARCGIAPRSPMDRAVLAVMGGSSQAAAARRFNVSRSTLRRRLGK